MSQRECSGFNWPPLSIPAQEPVSRSPEAVSRAGPFENFTACSSDAVCFRPSAVRPVASILSVLTDRPPLGVFGVGQPAKVLTCGRLTVAFDPSGLRPVALASFAICEPVALPTVGVGQPAITAAAPKSSP